MSKGTRFWWGFVFLALAVLAFGNWEYVADAGHRFATAKWWWLSSLVLLFGATLFDDTPAEPSPAGRWEWQHIAALLSVLLVAILFRVWRITEYPPPGGFGFEEYQTGGLAFHTYEDWSWTSEFPLTNWLPGVSFKLFGLSSYSLRGPFVVSGVLAPLFLFLALRRVVILPVAWATGMMLASSRWAASAARFADEIFFPISIIAASCWLAVCVVQQRRQRTAFFLGLVSSDLFYAYTGYRILPLIAYGVAVACAGVAWLRGRLKPGTVRALVMVASVWAVILSLGLLAAYLFPGSVFFEALNRHRVTWGERPAAETALGARLDVMWSRLRAGWDMYTTRGEVMAWINIPYEPMLDVVTAGIATVAVVWGVFRVLNPVRLVAWSMFVIPNVLLAAITANFNGERYFVFMVPLFAVMGFFLHDIFGWRRIPRWLANGLLAVLVVAIVGINARDLERTMTHPLVQGKFQSAENFILASLHSIPTGGRAVMFTQEGANAFEPSDYKFLTAHLVGGRPKSMPAGLTFEPNEQRPVYWLTQGSFEVEVLPKVIALICPQAQYERREGPNAYETIGTAWVASPAGCGPLPNLGLRGTYTLTDKRGAVSQLTEIDPVLFAYTMPWDVVLKLLTDQLAQFTAQWDADVLPKAPGTYHFEVQVQEGTVTLQVGDQQASAVAQPVEWRAAEVNLPLGADPVRISVRMTAARPSYPRVRLLWQAPGESLRIIEPAQLRPAG